MPTIYKTRRTGEVTVYRYTVSSAEHEDSERFPSAKFTFQISPMVRPVPPRWPPRELLDWPLPAGLVFGADQPRCGRSQAVVISEESVPLYHFLTEVCAIIGGLFTVFSMATGVLDATIKTIKKSQMGKLG